MVTYQAINARGLTLTKVWEDYQELSKQEAKPTVSDTGSNFFRPIRTPRPCRGRPAGGAANFPRACRTIPTELPNGRWTLVVNGLHSEPDVQRGRCFNFLLPHPAPWSPIAAGVLNSRTRPYGGSPAFMGKRVAYHTVLLEAARSLRNHHAVHG